MTTIDPAEIRCAVIRTQGAIAGLLCLLLAAACAGVKSPPSDTQAQSTAPPAGAAIIAPSPSPAPAPSPPTPVVTTPSGAAVLEPATPPVAPPTASQSAPKAAAPAAKAPPGAVSKPVVAEAAKKEGAAADVAKKASSTLDLKSLEQRLKDTSAIGVLTKISLKNQVDDLLDQFRAFYQGNLKTTLSDLRRSYDLLVLKVLALLQDSDPSLASAIVASREAIWGILADRVKFETIS
jgi:hypothetical protein